jgi:carbon storage regulator
MLILTRKPGESLYIGDNVKITIVEIKGHQIRVGIEAPAELRIYREEIYLQILEENKKAAEAPTSNSGLEGLSSAWKGRKSVDLSGKKPGDKAEPKRSIAALGASTPQGQGQPPGPQVVIRKKRGKLEGEDEDEE